jgi:hypothetical protein
MRAWIMLPELKRKCSRMSKMRLALYTFGVFRARADDPINRGFHDRNDVNFRIFEISDGFIARSGYEGDPGPECWGKLVYRRYGKIWPHPWLTLAAEFTQRPCAMEVSGL